MDVYPNSNDLLREIEQFLLASRVSANYPGSIMPIVDGGIFNYYMWYYQE